MEGHAGYFDGNIVVTDTATALPIPEGTIPARATLTVETAAIRWRYTGKTPFAGVGGGHLEDVSEKFVVEGTQNVRNFQMVRNTSTSANVFFTLESL